MTPHRTALVGLSLALALSLAACHRGDEQAKAASPGEAASGAASASDHDADREGGKDARKGDMDAPGKNADKDDDAPKGMVKLDGDALRDAHIKLATVELRPLETDLKTTGTFEADADHEAHVTPRVPGRVVRILVSTGARVRAGDVLAVIESFDAGQAQAEYLEAQAKLDLASTTAERQHKLFRGDLSAQKEVQAADNGLRLARIDLERASNRLRLYGYGDDRLAGLARRRRVEPTIALTAPVAGLVTERHVTLGEVIEPSPDKPVFVVVDTSRIWVNANVGERDLMAIHDGQGATVIPNAAPDQTYRGRVALVAAAIDEASRLGKARIVVPNPDGKLRPKMFATVNIAVGQREGIAVPQEAVVRDKDDTFAFVQAGEGTFKKQPLKLGPASNGYVQVLSGLERGEKVVVDGAFTLKSEMLKGSFGGDKD